MVGITTDDGVSSLVTPGVSSLVTTGVSSLMTHQVSLYLLFSSHGNRYREETAMEFAKVRNEEEGTFWRKMLLPEEERLRLFPGTTRPGGYRWFRIM